jgi:hypothetical protein
MDHGVSAASKESFVSKIDDGLREGDGAGAGAGAGAGLGLGDTEAPTSAKRSANNPHINVFMAGGLLKIKHAF